MPNIRRINMDTGEPLYVEVTDPIVNDTTMPPVSPDLAAAAFDGTGLEPLMETNHPAPAEHPAGSTLVRRDFTVAGLPKNRHLYL